MARSSPLSNILVFLAMEACAIGLDKEFVKATVYSAFVKECIAQEEKIQSSERTKTIASLAHTTRKIQTICFEFIRCETFIISNIPRSSLIPEKKFLLATAVFNGKLELQVGTNYPHLQSYDLCAPGNIGKCFPFTTELAWLKFRSYFWDFVLKKVDSESIKLYKEALQMPVYRQLLVKHLEGNLTSTEETRSLSHVCSYRTLSDPSVRIHRLFETKKEPFFTNPHVLIFHLFVQYPGTVILGCIANQITPDIRGYPARVSWWLLHFLPCSFSKHSDGFASRISRDQSPKLQLPGANIETNVELPVLNRRRTSKFSNLAGVCVLIMSEKRSGQYAFSDAVNDYKGLVKECLERGESVDLFEEVSSENYLYNRNRTIVQTCCLFIKCETKIIANAPPAGLLPERIFLLATACYNDILSIPNIGPCPDLQNYDLRVPGNLGRPFPLTAELVHLKSRSHCQAAILKEIAPSEIDLYEKSFALPVYVELSFTFPTLKPSGSGSGVDDETTGAMKENERFNPPIPAQLSSLARTENETEKLHSFDEQYKLGSARVVRVYQTKSKSWELSNTVALFRLEVQQSSCAIVAIMAEQILAHSPTRHPDPRNFKRLLHFLPRWINCEIPAVPIQKKSSHRRRRNISPILSDLILILNSERQILHKTYTKKAWRISASNMYNALANECNSQGETFALASSDKQISPKYFTTRSRMIRQAYFNFVLCEYKVISNAPPTGIIAEKVSHLATACYNRILTIPNVGCGLDLLSYDLSVPKNLGRPFKFPTELAWLKCRKWFWDFVLDKMEPSAQELCRKALRLPVFTDLYLNFMEDRSSKGLHVIEELVHQKLIDDRHKIDRVYPACIFLCEGSRSTSFFRLVVQFPENAIFARYAVDLRRPTDSVQLAEPSNIDDWAFVHFLPVSFPRAWEGFAQRTSNTEDGPPKLLRKALTDISDPLLSQSFSELQNESLRKVKKARFKPSISDMHVSANDAKFQDYGVVMERILRESDESMSFNAEIPDLE